MRSRQAARKAAFPASSGQTAITIGEALIFLRREATYAGLAELAESLSQSINTAAKLAANE